MSSDHEKLQSTLKAIEGRLQAIEGQKKDVWDMVTAIAIALLVAVVGVIAVLATLRVQQSTTETDKSISALELRLKMLGSRLDADVRDREQVAHLMKIFYDDLSSGDPKKLRLAGQILDIFGPALRRNLAHLLANIEETPEDVALRAQRISRAEWAHKITDALYNSLEELRVINITYDPTHEPSTTLALAIHEIFNTLGIGAPFKLNPGRPQEFDLIINTETDIAIEGYDSITSHMEEYLRFRFPDYRVHSIRPRWRPPIQDPSEAFPFEIIINAQGLDAKPSP